jgi:hypothetical protein
MCSAARPQWIFNNFWMQPAVCHMPYNRAMTHLDILLPFGLPPKELAPDLLREMKAPSLATLIARAKSRNVSPRDDTFDGFARALPHEAWLSRQFGLESVEDGANSPPVAAALMRSMGLAPEPGLWFVINPVHIHIARDHLVLSDARRMPLTANESRRLFDIAQPLFDESGKTLLYGDERTWFARADEWSALRTATPDAASGHNIDIWMPKGGGERNWRKLQNEVQMHWHMNAVNEERESKGIQPVNSIWLWGGAPVPINSATSAYTMAFGLNGWMRAFAQLAAGQLPASTAADILEHAPQSGLLVLDTLLEPALANEWSDWLARVHAIETEWLAPLAAALKSGKIDRLSLILTDHARISTFAASRSSLRKFWVKPSLAALLS